MIIIERAVRADALVLAKLIDEIEVHHGGAPSDDECADQIIRLLFGPHSVAHVLLA
ncbi:hypothetical protein ABZ470_32360 [Streptosporangium sp. NPDC020072]|uniref:hypothetical protein n=1 Tax=Streptosporangium sp. NPDC020072 TaxID=3154788 RepID=UPI00341D2475